MDLSSSATQRSTTSEALSIQPGSVRNPAVDAANDFARHLAEKERPERTAERPREARDERETESRKAAGENEAASEEPSRSKAPDAVKPLQMTEGAEPADTTVEAAPEEEPAEVAAAGNAEEVAAKAPAADAPDETDETLPEADAIEAVTPETDEGEAVPEEGNAGGLANAAATETEAVSAAPITAATAASQNDAKVTAP